MAGGLAALLDDVAALARLAAASADDVAAASARAGTKAAGVVVDDAAVTPQYVRGIEPRRELPIIWRIAKGSILNKLVIILPVALLLSEFAPFVLSPLLMLGGLYLCYEGAEKIWELVKADDVGLAMVAEESEAKQRAGRALVTAMPVVMTVISYVGMVAMLWVGGHIILVGTHDLGAAQPYGWIHGMEDAVAGITGIGGVLAWLLNTFFSFLLGVTVGAVAVLIMHLLPVGHHGDPDPEPGGAPT